MDLWNHIHAERTRLVDALDGLDTEQWAARSLSSEWTVEQVVAHLTAVARTGRLQWVRSIVSSGFNPQKHNNKLLNQHIGANPAETLTNFRNAVALTVAPSKDLAAFLGEVIVHSQDIARPLGMNISPDSAGLLEVARFFATKNFAVNSKTLIAGLRLEADDASFSVGNGPLATGPLLELVMVMAGRGESLNYLSGDGVAELAQRIR